jgi:hypothetical protein
LSPSYKRVLQFLPCPARLRAVVSITSTVASMAMLGMHVAACGTTMKAEARGFDFDEDPPLDDRCAACQGEYRAGSASLTRAAYGGDWRSPSGSEPTHSALALGLLSPR